jgi:hypothetical protein
MRPDGAHVDGEPPVVGRALLAAMRISMRIVNHLLPVMNRMARAQRADRGHDRQD